MLLLLSIERALRKYELINFEKVYGLIGRVSILKTAELFRLLSAYVTEKKINKSQSICSDEDTFVVVITAIVYLTVTPCKSLFKKLVKSNFFGPYSVKISCIFTNHECRQSSFSNRLSKARSSAYIKTVYNNAKFQHL